MRPGVAAALLVAAVAVVAAFVLLGRPAGDGEYRVAVEFDSAKGMVAGQQVKIAGAPVGTVESIGLAPGPKARMVLRVDGRFAPFRTDGTCTILPQGLISENFVECDPGQAGDPLPASDGGVPTLPVAQTTVPVSLQDLINVFSLPTDQRLRVLINELGLATAGRGEDLNTILRRTNPALEQSREVLAILDGERGRLTDSIDQTDKVLGALAEHDTDLQSFVANSATVAKEVGDHRSALSETLAGLPAMLDTVQPGLASLDHAVDKAAPLLSDLRRSAPGLRQVNNSLPTFARLGRTATDRLADAAARGVPAVKAARPVVASLEKSLGPVSDNAESAQNTLLSLRKTGGIEGVLRVAYAFANNTSLYDDVSHVLTFIVNVAPLCIAGQQAQFDVPGCSRKYDAPGRGRIPINDVGCGPKVMSWGTDHCKKPAPGPLSLEGLSSLASAKKAKPGSTADKQQDIFSRLAHLNDRALSGANPDPDRFKPLLDFLLK